MNDNNAEIKTQLRRKFNAIEERLHAHVDQTHRKLDTMLKGIIQINKELTNGLVSVSNAIHRIENHLKK